MLYESGSDDSIIPPRKTPPEIDKGYEQLQSVCRKSKEVRLYTLLVAKTTLLGEEADLRDWVEFKVAPMCEVLDPDSGGRYVFSFAGEGEPVAVEGDDFQVEPTTLRLDVHLVDEIVLAGVEFEVEGDIAILSECQIVYGAGRGDTTAADIEAGGDVDSPHRIPDHTAGRIDSRGAGRAGPIVDSGAKGAKNQGDNKGRCT